MDEVQSAAAESKTEVLWCAGASTGEGEVDAACVQFGSGGGFLPPTGSLTLQAYEPCVLFTTLKACIRN